MSGFVVGGGKLNFPESWEVKLTFSYAKCLNKMSTSLALEGPEWGQSLAIGFYF